MNGYGRNEIEYAKARKKFAESNVDMAKRNHDIQRKESPARNRIIHILPITRLTNPLLFISYVKNVTSQAMSLAEEMLEKAESEYEEAVRRLAESGVYNT